VAWDPPKGRRRKHQNVRALTRPDQLITAAVTRTSGEDTAATEAAM